LGGPALERWFPRFVIVLEGAAARGLDAPDVSEPGVSGLALEGLGLDGRGVGGLGVGGFSVVRARGSGADGVVRQGGIAGPCLVVTADRELRTRCEAVGAAVVGPRWLLDLL